MQIVLIGAPGSGKGTQGDLLSAHYGIPRLSTGDALRQAARLHTAIGYEAKAAMDAGELVEDRIVIRMIEDRLAMDDAGSGFILDGFPSNVRQAQILDAALARQGRAGIDAALHFEVPDDELVRRTLARGVAQGRSDDSEATVSHRLSVYHSQAATLFKYYADQNKLLTRSGTGSVGEVFDEAVDALDRFVTTPLPI